MRSVILQKRAINSDISEYLENNLSAFRSLDYSMEDLFEEEKLAQYLDEDLPLANNSKSKSDFIGDLIGVSKNFFELTSSKKIRIQLEVIKSDACRLFHVDNNYQRLLCTYHGPGTEWLAEDNLNREGLGKGNNANIVKDESLVNHTTPFDLLTLRGKKFGENFQGGVHRSPPVEKKFLTRILLKVDEIN